MPQDEPPVAGGDKNHPSRRTLLGGVGGGLLAAPALLAAGTAQAQQQGGSAGSPALPNPVNQYAHPPFPRQTQPPPGLQYEMHPLPDCGETSYRGSGRLTGRKALITGGDSGIGRATAIAFAREGADVAINFLPVEEPDAAEVVRLIRAAERKAVPIPGDIRDEAFCNRLVNEAVTGLGGLDILVNNAGHQQAQAALENLSTTAFDATMKTNLYALFWITKAALPHLPAGAAIINTASIEAFDPSQILFDYAATKAAIVAMTQVLAKQLGPRGIRVNAVAPGPVWTPLQISGGQPPDAIPQFGAKTPLGRAGQPAELAPVYVLLASSEASYTTGDVLGTTGGRPMP